jgi:hypothetical protein
LAAPPQHVRTGIVHGHNAPSASTQSRLRPGAHTPAEFRLRRGAHTPKDLAVKRRGRWGNDTTMPAGAGTMGRIRTRTSAGVILEPADSSW